MWELQKRKKIQMYVYSEISLIVLAVIIFFIARATWGVYKKDVESAKAATEVAEQAAALEARQDALTAENKRLGTIDGQEEAIREKFSVAKPGEEMYIIVDPEAATASSATSTATSTSSWWHRLEAFLGRKSQ